jgi:hypothetical protein
MVCFKSGHHSIVVVLGLLLIGLLTASAYAQPDAQPTTDPVGTVIFTSGQAQIQRGEDVLAIQRGSFIHTGDTLTTGTDGYIQVRMLDSGFLSLRPASHLTVASYAFDPENAVQNRIKLELHQGVVRSVTGDAGARNKDAFRLNTPIAAIGIRGTDFTTYTDEVATKVSVSSGGISMSPFNAQCMRELSGNCQDATILMATAAKGHYLVISHDSLQAELMQDGPAPDDIQPPHPSEQLLLDEADVRANFWQNRTFRGQAAAGATSYEDGLARVERYLSSPGLAVEAFARGERAGNEVFAPDRQLIPSPHISWGRWSHLSDTPSLTRVNPIAFMIGNGYQYAAVNSAFALLEKTPTEAAAGSGRVYFSLNRYEAYLKRGNSLEAAGISNAALIVDFDESRFGTRMDLHAESLPGKAHIVGAGDINGRYLSSDANSPALIDGVLTSGNKEAGLLFEYQIQPGLNAVGSTHWVKD